MKKYPSILIAALMATSVASTFAQGTVVFNNGAEGPVKYWTDPYVPAKGGAMVQLFWAATGTPYAPWTPSLTPAAWYAANPGWSLGPVVGCGIPSPGRFNGGTLTLSPLAPGGTIDYVIAGWTGVFQFMDAALAGNALAGVSSKFTTATGNPTVTPPGTAVPLADSFGGLNLIPEPSTVALAALGAATLLALRRRK
jgi:hypothetical protein